MNRAKEMIRLAMLATVFAFVSPTAFAGTVTVQHGTLSATLGAPVNFSYTPDWYVVNDPTHTHRFGIATIRYAGQHAGKHSMSRFGESFGKPESGLERAVADFQVQGQRR